MKIIEILINEEQNRTSMMYTLHAPIEPLYYKLSRINEDKKTLEKDGVNILEYKKLIINTHTEKLDPEKNGNRKFYISLEDESDKNMMLHLAITNSQELIRSYDELRFEVRILGQKHKILEKYPEVFRRVQELKDIIDFNQNIYGKICGFFDKDILGTINGGLWSIDHFTLFDDDSRERAQFVNKEITDLFYLK